VFLEGLMEELEEKPDTVIRYLTSCCLLTPFFSIKNKRLFTLYPVRVSPLLKETP
jgi:hypothetical protein